MLASPCQFSFSASGSKVFNQYYCPAKLTVFVWAKIAVQEVEHDSQGSSENGTQYQSVRCWLGNLFAFVHAKIAVHSSDGTRAPPLPPQKLQVTIPIRLFDQKIDLKDMRTEIYCKVNSDESLSGMRVNSSSFVVGLILQFLFLEYTKFA